MSLSTYTPQLGQAFRLPVQQPLAFVRLAAPWFALMLAGLFVRDAMPAAGTLALVSNAVALGGLGFTWQRFIGGAQAAPLSPVAYGLRLLLCVLAYQALLGFELFAAILMNILLEGQANAALLVKGGQQVFQILIGGMFLILPHLAMGTSAEVRGTRLQEIVLAAGISVGFGYVLGYLPFLVLSEMAREAFGGVESLMLVAVQHVVNFFAVAVAAGYFALVWLDLRVTAPSPTGAIQPAEPVPAKAKAKVKAKRKR